MGLLETMPIIGALVGAISWIFGWIKKTDASIHHGIRSMLVEDFSPSASDIDARSKKTPLFKIGEHIGIERFDEIIRADALNPVLLPYPYMQNGKAVIIYRGAVITGECPHCGFVKNYHFGCPHCKSLM